MQDNTPSNIPSDNSAMYAFYLKAIVVFAALLGFYYGWFLDSAWYDKLLAFIVENTSKLLHGLGLEHKVAFDRMAGFAEIRTEVGGGIVNGGLVLINERCDAYLETALMLSVLLVWPGSIAKKLVFAVCGIALMTVLNLLRIVALAAIDHYWPLYFPTMSQWVLPGIMILAALAYFYLWVRASRAPSPIR